MKIMKRFFYIFVWVSVFSIVVMGAFYAGGLAYRYEIYFKVPGSSFITKLLEPAFFYPAPQQDNSQIEEIKIEKMPYSFIVYGDSRELAHYQKSALISKIIQERPSFVVHLGDMVNCADAHQWEIFDHSEGKIIDRGIPFYPVLGNHEYRSRKEIYPPHPEMQLKYYFDRFPFLKNRRWYSFISSGIEFLILDTNTDYSPGSKQYEWLVNKLKGESPGFLFIALHHPLYTKSDYGRKPEKLLAQLFAGNNNKGQKKPDLVFSGHIHNYERYQYNGIYYIISGGGGAPQLPIKRGPNDFYTQPGDAFHYCKITVSEGEINFAMVKLDEDTGKWEIADSFSISKQEER